MFVCVCFTSVCPLCRHTAATSLTALRLDSCSTKAASPYSTPPPPELAGVRSRQGGQEEGRLDSAAPRRAGRQGGVCTGAPAVLVRRSDSEAQLEDLPALTVLPAHRYRPFKVMLSHGADANATSDTGLTPLHKAAIEGHTAAAQVGAACTFCCRVLDSLAKQVSGDLPLADVAILPPAPVVGSRRRQPRQCPRRIPSPPCGIVPGACRVCSGGCSSECPTRDCVAFDMAPDEAKHRCRC